MAATVPDSMPSSERPCARARRSTEPGWPVTRTARSVVEGVTLSLDGQRCRGILPRRSWAPHASALTLVNGGVGAALRHLAEVDALIVIGGEGTLGGIELAEEHHVPFVGTVRRRSTTM